MLIMEDNKTRKINKRGKEGREKARERERETWIKKSEQEIL